MQSCTYEYLQVLAVVLIERPFLSPIFEMDIDIHNLVGSQFPHGVFLFWNLSCKVNDNL